MQVREGATNACLLATYDTCNGELMHEHQLLLYLVQFDEISMLDDLSTGCIKSMLRGALTLHSLTASVTLVRRNLKFWTRLCCRDGDCFATLCKSAVFMSKHCTLHTARTARMECIISYFILCRVQSFVDFSLLNGSLNG